MTVEFLPSDIENRNVTHLLSYALSACYSVEGSIAFWTLGIDAINGDLLDALSRVGSSICVDMQFPTNFHKLARFEKEISKRKNSPAVFICLRKHQNDTRNETVSLLHTKILLFELGNKEWEIWVGSHNFTANALVGRNLEGSIRIQGSSEDPKFADLLAQVRQYLTYIKTLCEPFDPLKITFYEVMRGDIDKSGLKKRFEQEIADRIIIEETIISRVLTFQCKDANSLSAQTIILLGNLYDELALLRHRNRGGSPVFLRIRDSDTGVIYTYEGKIRNFDNIDTVPSYNVSFNQRRWAVRNVYFKGEVCKPPILKPSANIGKKIISENSYYINVEVIRQVDNEFIGYYTYPETDPTKLWRLEQESVVDTNLPSVFSKELLPLDNPSSALLVPVNHAEELASIRSIDWTIDYMDGILERRILVFGKYKTW